MTSWHSFLFQLKKWQPLLGHLWNSTWQNYGDKWSEICTINSGDCCRSGTVGGGVYRELLGFTSADKISLIWFIVVQTNSVQMTNTEFVGVFFSFNIHPSYNSSLIINKVSGYLCVPADIRLEAGMQPEQVSCPSSSTHTWGNLESLMRIQYMLSEITHWNTDFKLSVSWWIVKRLEVIHSLHVLLFNGTEEKQ